MVRTTMTDDADGRRRVRAVVSGDIDVAVAGQLQDRLDAVRADGTTDLVVDTTEVTFLDSSGLRAFVVTRGRFEADGGTLVIDGMSRAVRRVLELSGLLDGDGGFDAGQHRSDSAGDDPRR